jgi:hypothetical protein
MAARLSFSWIQTINSQNAGGILKARIVINPGLLYHGTSRCTPFDITQTPANSIQIQGNTAAEIARRCCRLMQSGKTAKVTEKIK